jgi:hypothetical protein
MGTINFEFSSAQGNLAFAYTVSDDNLTRLITYLRDKYATPEGAAPDLVMTPANTSTALSKATKEVVEQWKDSTLRFETAIEAANISIPPIDVTES